jgi:membrane-bound serine protease (ClpP class)
MRTRWPLAALLGWSLLAVWAAGVPARAAPAAQAQAAPAVTALELDGAVDPFVAGYLADGIAAADTRGDAAVLLRIDTPGGLDSAMRTIVKAILAARVPVLCWTGPSGARAASAGTFVMLACPLNAMAPGTNIGAAHPVGVSGAIEEEKVTNDAAAFARSLAERTGRNGDWAERAVRESVSLSAEAAVDQNVADLLAASTTELLQKADGRKVTTAAGQVTLRTAGASVQEQAPGVAVALLHGLIDPNLAFVFFYLGLILIVIEVLHPGISVPGILGGLLLLVSIVSFGILPVRLAGVALLAASVVLFGVELKHPGVGLPLAGGLACLILGGLLLFDPALPGPGARVSPWLLAAVAAVLAAFFLVVVRAVVAARRLPAPAAGLDGLVGEVGVALGPLAPRGEVRVAHERWSAEAARGAIPAGTAVRVVGRKGLKLIVEPGPSLPRQPKGP